MTKIYGTAKEREYSQKWRDSNRAKLKMYRIKRMYGLSEDQYDQILLGQKGVCAICKKDCAVKPSLAVDHCHETDRIRGLLCFKCNTALGHFNDDPVLLARAIEYLCE